ncbi:MAG TPA: hypothetical protein VG917_02360 [Patescibacteria group bacterium]|nr:hypothetical protein [Patescibacteria group bacterium]
MSEPKPRQGAFPTPSESSTKLHEEKFDREKFINDLKAGGFQITIQEEDGAIRFIEVVTKNGDDLFFAQTKFGHLDKTDDYQGYLSFNLDVRRRKKVPGEKGSATHEVWKMQWTTFNQNYNNYRIQEHSGGLLDENEFWRRYKSSQIDPEATRKYFEFRKLELEKAYGGARGADIFYEENPTIEESNLPNLISG